MSMVYLGEVVYIHTTDCRPLFFTVLASFLFLVLSFGVPRDFTSLFFIVFTKLGGVRDGRSWPSLSSSPDQTSFSGKAIPLFFFI